MLKSLQRMAGYSKHLQPTRQRMLQEHRGFVIGLSSQFSNQKTCFEIIHSFWYNIALGNSVGICTGLE